MRPLEEKSALPEGPVRFTGTLGPDVPAGYPMHHFYTEKTGLWLPPDPTQVVGDGQETLFSSANLGVARFDGKQTHWYRTNDLLGDNGRLRMACVPSGCYLPGEGGRAYRVDQETFKEVRVAGDAGAKVQGFFTDAGGELYSMHAPSAGRSLVVSRLEERSFRRIYEIPISLPAQSKVEVRFCRVDAERRPWVGLWHVGPDQVRQYWGAVRLAPLPGGQRRDPEEMDLPAWADPEEEEMILPEWAGGAKLMTEEEEGAKAAADAGAAIIFRSTLLPGEDRPTGSLALPDDIRDVWFGPGQEVWLATGSGVLRVRGKEVDTFTENEGLASEITYTGLIEPRGVLVGSYAGVGRHDGKEWRFDLAEQLNFPSRAMLRAGNWLLVGTSRGVVQHGRTSHRYLDEGIGLATNGVTDLYLDQQKRLWVLAEGALSILSGF